MQFDTTVNLGHVLTFGLAVAAIFSGWYSMRGQMALLGQRMESLDEELRRVTNILEKLSSQEARIAVLEESIRNIQRDIDDVRTR